MDIGMKWSLQILIDRVVQRRYLLRTGRDWIEDPLYPAVVRGDKPSKATP